MEETQRRLRGHQFMPTKVQMRKIPAMGATESTPAEDKIIGAHYFCASADWYIAELDPETGQAFGYARLATYPEGAEWGYIDLAELEAARLRPFVVERDMYWSPCKFSEI